MVDRRHEHQKATRQRHVGRDAGALGAQGLLDDLDQDLLALLEQVLDLGLGFPLAIAVLAAGTIATTVVPLARVGWAAAEGWREDYFVDAIPYSETRRFVREVLTNYATYRRLYGDGAPSPRRP